MHFLTNNKCFLLAIVKRKRKQKLAYAVYCALSSELLKIWATYIYFRLHLHTVYTFDFCYVITKWPKRGTNSKKHNVSFFALPNANMQHIYWINTCRNVCGAIFANVPSTSTYAEISQFFLIPSLPCKHFER